MELDLEKIVRDVTQELRHKAADQLAMATGAELLYERIRQAAKQQEQSRSQSGGAVTEEE